jgi:cytochrome c1
LPSGLPMHRRRLGPNLAEPTPVARGASCLHLLAWIRDPQGIDPGSAMPTTRIGEADAHAIVAYLRGLR